MTWHSSGDLNFIVVCGRATRPTRIYRRMGKCVRVEKNIYFEQTLALVFNSKTSYVTYNILKAYAQTLDCKVNTLPRYTANNILVLIRYAKNSFGSSPILEFGKAWFPSNVSVIATNRSCLLARTLLRFAGFHRQPSSGLLRGLLYLEACESRSASGV